MSVIHTSSQQTHPLLHLYLRQHYNHQMRATLPLQKCQTSSSAKKKPSTSSPLPPNVQSTSCTPHTNGSTYTISETLMNPNLFTPVCSSCSCTTNTCQGPSRNATQITLLTCPKVSPHSTCTLAVVIVGCHRMS